MGEQRQTPARAPDQPEAGDAFPSVDALDEAHRNATNFLAGYEGILTLKSVLEATLAARQQYDALQVAIAHAQQQQEEAQGAVAVVQQQQQALAADFQRQRDQALAAHQEYLGALQAEAVALEEPLQQQRDALRETRQQAERLKATMVTEAQRQAQAEKAQALTELVRLRQEKSQLQADCERLTTQRDQLSADLAATIRRLSEVGA